MRGTYESDFYAWTNAQAALLRAGRLAEDAFPTACPFTDEQLVDDGYWPE